MKVKRIILGFLALVVLVNAQQPTLPTTLGADKWNISEIGKQEPLGIFQYTVPRDPNADPCVIGKYQQKLAILIEHGLAESQYYGCLEIEWLDENFDLVNTTVVKIWAVKGPNDDFPPMLFISTGEVLDKPGGPYNRQGVFDAWLSQMSTYADYLLLEIPTGAKRGRLSFTTDFGFKQVGWFVLE